MNMAKSRVYPYQDRKRKTTAYIQFEPIDISNSLIPRRNYSILFISCPYDKDKDKENKKWKYQHKVNQLKEVDIVGDFF